MADFTVTKEISSQLETTIGSLPVNYSYPSVYSSVLPGNNNMGLIIGATVGAVVLLIIAIGVTILCIRIRQMRNTPAEETAAATQLVQAAVNTNPQLITEPIPLDPTAKGISVHYTM